ncbi:hypothetical protein BJX63DRAFT_430018 [Aspergillus granulosus]|uniref:Uncharacterized protein n=1 Tax=Aspergillus granulosus TaxID=176169 RepID=A0ABR4HNA1_9EURO
MTSTSCNFEVQTPSRQLLICLFVAASYIPQLLQIATNDHAGNAGISGWYIIILTTSASTHLAARLNDIPSSEAWRCFRHGELEGFSAFSALVVYLQVFVHWVTAIILLALYVAFRTKATPGNESQPYTNSPSNPAILAIVLTHAAVTLPSAFYLLKQLTKESQFDNIFIFVLSTFYAQFLRITGLLSSLTSFIPQIYLMVTRPRDGNPDKSNLSMLCLGLQVIAFTFLACSQGWRMRPPPPPPNPLNPDQYPTIWGLKWWVYILFASGMAAGWLALAVSQLVVLCVAPGLGKGGGYIQL